MLGAKSPTNTTDDNDDFLCAFATRQEALMQETKYYVQTVKQQAADVHPTFQELYITGHYQHTR